jgi:hypothetical protein
MPTTPIKQSDVDGLAHHRHSSSSTFVGLSVFAKPSSPGTMDPGATYGTEMQVINYQCAGRSIRRNGRGLRR